MSRIIHNPPNKMRLIIIRTNNTLSVVTFIFSQKIEGGEPFSIKINTFLTNLHLHAVYLEVLGVSILLSISFNTFLNFSFDMKPITWPIGFSL